MKIALINPPYTLAHYTTRARNSFIFPLGLGYIAAYLRQAGHKAAIFDLEPGREPLEKFWKDLEAFMPDLVGITSVTPNFTPARQLAMEAKRRLGCLVIMGGPHVTALPRSSLEGAEGLDAVILGEGELPMLALAAGFDAHGRADFSGVPGAAFIENGVYKENPRPEPISDLDCLPYPARDLVDIELYFRQHRSEKRGKSATVISSRGCPSQCTYCANICMGRKFRPRSPGNFVGELERLYREHGIRHFHIVDDCLTADPRRVSEICDLIVGKGLRITWDAFGRVNTLRDEAVILKMKRAGCLYLGMGIETGNQRINDLMRKGTTLAMAEESCSLLRKHGIPYINAFIIGNEGDTRETVLDTIAFAKKLKSATAIFNMLIPYPGTPLFNKYYKDYDAPGTDWSLWCSEGRDRPYEPRQTALTKEEIFRLRARAYRQFYFDPFQLFRTVAFGMKV